MKTASDGMDVNLSGKNITELSFKTDDLSKEETSAAVGVRTLCAERNQITRLVGLGDVFSRLVEVRLAHNNLGAGTAAPAAVVPQAAPHIQALYCEGRAQWLAALPPSLEVIDVSHNLLQSFAHCTCHSTPLSIDAAPIDGTEQTRRYLRHACPMAVALFFPSESFPNLRTLNASHNALSVTLRESDAMEAVWGSITEESEDTLYSCVEDLDLSYNSGLCSVNCVLLSSPSTIISPLATLRVMETSIDDLGGLAAASVHAPRLVHLYLHPSPISQSLIHASPKVLADLVEALLLPILGGAPPAAAEESLAHAGVRKAISQLVSQHTNELATIVADKTQLTLQTCVYAALLREVIPSLEILNAILPVEMCCDTILEATQVTLLSQRATTELPPASSILDVERVRRRGGCHSMEASPTHHSRVEVVIGEAQTQSIAYRHQDSVTSLCSLVDRQHGNHADTPISEPLTNKGGVDWFTPTAMTSEEKRVYECLCATAQQLEKKLAEVQHRARETTEMNSKLRAQLSSDRQLIADQRRQLSTLKEQQRSIKDTIADQKRRLKRKQLDVTYGVQAIESKVISAQQQEAAKRLEEREKALQANEKALKQRMALIDALSVHYSHKSASSHHGVPRSVALREAAIKKKIKAQNLKDSLTYTPLRFRRENVEPPPKHAPYPEGCHSDEEECYFKLYEEEARLTAASAAKAYCANLPGEQRAQLQAAIHIRSHSHSSHSRDTSPHSPPHSPTLRPPPPMEQLSTSHVSSTEQSAQHVDRRDLSAMSLSELFDAAAAIRRKQLTLQQREQQQHHAAPLPVAPPTSFLLPHNDTVENDIIGPALTPAAVVTSNLHRSPRSNAKDIYSAIVAQQRLQCSKETVSPPQLPAEVGEAPVADSPSSVSSARDGGWTSASNSASGETLHIVAQLEVGSEMNLPAINRALFA